MTDDRAGEHAAVRGERLAADLEHDVGAPPALEVVAPGFNSHLLLNRLNFS